MKLRSLKRAAAFLLCLTLLASFSAAMAADSAARTDGGELKQEWTLDQTFTLADPAPWNLEELKQVVDVQDPRSVAAYFVWAMGVGADGWGADSRDWAFGNGLTADTGLEISANEDCPRSAVVAFLYRSYAEQN